MRTDVPGGRSPRITTREFPASETRPEGFPESVPFIPGVQSAVWIGEDGSAAGCSWVIALEDRKAFEAHRREAHAIGAAGAGVPAVAAFAAAGSAPDAGSLRAAADQAPRSLLNRVASFFRSAGKSDAGDRARALLDRVVAASAADGWEEENGDAAPVPLVARSVRLRRGARVRHLTAAAHPGAGGYVMMMEGAA